MGSLNGGAACVMLYVVRIWLDAFSAISGVLSGLLATVRVVAVEN